MFNKNSVDMNSSARIAVTGANGFIGTHLCKLLHNEGFYVISIIFDGKSPSAGEERRCDITNIRSTVDALSDADIVVHLAGVSNPAKCADDFDYAYLVNVEGTRNVIKATASKRLVFSSSAHVYGMPSSKGKCSENDPLLGKTPYAMTKILCEVLCNNYHLNYGHNITVVRLFNIFGEFQHGGYLIPTLITQALSGKGIVIRSMNLVRDFLYVGDAARALLTVVGRGNAGETYNIGSGLGTEISKVVDYVLKVANGGENLQIKETGVLSQEPPLLVGNIEKISKLGWKPKYSLFEGLDSTIEFYRNLGYTLSKE